MGSLIQTFVFSLNGEFSGSLTLFVTVQSLIEQRVWGFLITTDYEN